MLEEVYKAIKYDKIEVLDTYVDTLTFNSKTVDLLNTFMFQAIKYNAVKCITMLICHYGANPIVYNNWTPKYSYYYNGGYTWNLLHYGCGCNKCKTETNDND